MTANDNTLKELEGQVCSLYHKLEDLLEEVDQTRNKIQQARFEARVIFLEKEVKINESLQRMETGVSTAA